MKQFLIRLALGTALVAYGLIITATVFDILTVDVRAQTVSQTGPAGVTATLQTQTDTVMVGGVNVKEINAVTPLMGNGGTGTGSQRVTIASDNTPFIVKTTPKDSLYETVAASQTAQVLGGSGATGDYLAGCLVVPATTSPGQVLILDNATSITAFVGGASSVSNLVPFFIPWGAISASGAYKITTGANVSVVCFGTFT